MAHIGYVSHIAHFVAKVVEITEHHVECDSRAGMSEMSVAVDRGAADIHPYATFVDRTKCFLLARKRIVDGQVVRFHL